MKKPWTMKVTLPLMAALFLLGAIVGGTHRRPNGAWRIGAAAEASAPSYSIGFQCEPQASAPFLSGRTGYYADNSTPSRPLFQSTDNVQTQLVNVSPKPTTKGQFPAYSGSNGRYLSVAPGTDGTALVWDSTSSTGLNSTTAAPLTATNTATVSGKTLSGASNTFSNIPVSAITGGVTASTTLWYSPVSAAAVSTVSVVGGTQSSGTLFLATSPMTITGLNVYYPDNTSRSIIFSLWRCNDGSNCIGANSTKVATVTSILSTVGAHALAFGSSYSLGSGDTYRRFMLSFSQTGGGSYWRYNTSNSQPGGALLQSGGGVSPMTCVMGGPSICWGGFSNWNGTTDTPPTNGPASEFYPIEPTFTIP